MKKRIARSVVYFGLTCLTALVLSHPYIWQSIFGPTIKGEPLWAWQQEFRARNDSNVPPPPTLWTKVLGILRIDSQPLRWIGEFPGSDPELLPVLLSLANDSDERIRGAVAYALGNMGFGEQTIAALITMLDDRSPIVCHAALHTLRQFDRKSAPALPKLRVLLKDSNPEIAIHAALVMCTAGDPSPEARAIVYDGVQSGPLRVRLHAYHQLPAAFKDDDEMFRILVRQSAKETGPNERWGSIQAMDVFGKKAVPILIPLLKDPAVRQCAAGVLANIGPDAAEAIPSLEQLVDSPDERIHWIVNYALKRIDPERAAKK